MGMESKEFKALISLLDDDDEQIVTHVQEKILSLGTQVIPFLEQEWESNFNSQVHSVNGKFQLLSHKHINDAQSDRITFSCLKHDVDHRVARAVKILRVRAELKLAE